MNMEQSFDRLEAETDKVLAERRLLICAAQEALEYFEQRADVYDGDYGEPTPNEEARLAQMLQQVLYKVGSL